MELEDVVRQLIERQAAVLEDMAKAMLLVKRPEWDIVRIHSSEVVGMAFVCSGQEMPPCLERLSSKELENMIHKVTKELSNECSETHH